MTPKMPKPPPVPAPAAIPTVGQETEEQRIRALRRRSGFEKTQIVGNLAPKTGRKTTLG